MLKFLKMQSATRPGQDTDTSTASANTELELKPAVEAEDGATSKKFYVARRKRKWDRFHRFECKKSCAVYLLIIALIWLLHTIPIIVFFSVNAMVSVLLNWHVFVNFIPNVNFSSMQMMQ